ncbi:uncharacterized protein LOC130895244 [Diorhabda carinulata]|uniref:uncharacterized protein LOC130895244 n=1 Tax=Diorhabda carinulata TaxID=1163345 RepID=UPI0025A235F0|nr:uncharacterized protein LOC130895244 [Diorhabda carinulata]
MKFVFLLIIILLVLTTNPCASYKQVYKENIRNCLENTNDNVKLNDTSSIRSEELSLHISDLILKVTNETLSISFKPDVSEDGRKMKQSTSKLIEYLLVPAFMMSGMMPWFMPKLQMMVMMISMMNNMMFTSGLFSLVRNFVFEKQPDEHVIYVNNGFRNKSPYYPK